MSDRKMAFRYKMTVNAVLELDEAQLGALDALAGYGADAFLKVFYKSMGETYMRPYEAGLRSLFERIQATVPSALSEIGDARRLLDDRERKRTRWAGGPQPLPRDMVEGDIFNREMRG